MNHLAVIARWMIAIPAGLLFALSAIGNWAVLAGALIGRVKSGFSLVLPFLGAPLGLIFLIAVPTPGAIRYWWVAFVAEPSWLLGLLFLVAAGLKRLGGSRDA